MAEKIEFERDPYLTVTSTSAERACDFFGVPHDTRVEDTGPPDRPERFHPKARVFHVYVGKRGS